MTDSSIGQIFVLGTARSGTTWLANLLASHPSIAAVTAPQHQGIHESHLLSHTRYCFPAQLSFDAFLERYQEEDYFKLTGLAKGSLSGKWTGNGSTVDFFRVIMEEFARRRRADFWLEKTPKHTIYYRELAAAFPDARFVLIRRNRLDTLRSQLAKYPRTDAPRWRQVIEKVFRYESDMRALQKVEQCYPERAISVRYEDLVEQSQTELQRIVNFLGLEYVEMESQFPADSSFKHGSNQNFSFSVTDRILIGLGLVLFSIVPLQAMNSLRKRRDLQDAKSFPKYRTIQ